MSTLILLTCPFCGSEPVYKKEPKRAHLILCPSQECPATPICVSEELDRVVLKWNTRAPFLPGKN